MIALSLKNDNLNMIQNLHTVLKPLFYLLIISTEIIFVANGQSSWDSVNNVNDENWQGQWFPYGPGMQDDKNPSFTINHGLYDPKHGVVMGIEDPTCDDGQTNLQLDWDYNPINYTCFSHGDKVQYRPRSGVRPLYTHEHIPFGYSAPHACMNKAIEYDDIIPTFGAHRPLWAKYGEYRFLPKQRWVHNLEHGAVVMLYHPCANKNEVNVLKILVKKCLYRHIITPFNLLSPERPLALVTWGHRLEMSKVAPEIVLDFIKQHALKGPEQTFKDGQFSVLLEEHARVVSDLYDHDLCKVYDFVQ